MKYEKFKLDLAVKSELIEILYQNLAIGLFGIFILATVLILEITNFSNRNYLLLWYGGLSLNLLCGFILIPWYQKTKHELKFQNYHYYLYILGSSLTAVFLGIISSALMPIDLSHQTLVIIIVICIASAAIQSLHASYLASYTYLAFAILPLIIWESLQIWHGEQIYAGILFGTICYLLYLVAEIYRGHNTIVNNIKLKLTNIQINKKLKIQKEDIEFLSKHDVLTNLFNRRYLEELLFELDKNPPFAQTKISVFMFDIDNFKEVNDIFGHEAGDAVLSKLGMLIKEFFDETTLAFRYGGEEFLIIQKGLSPFEAYKLADEFRNKVKHSYIKLESKTKFIVTISGGVAIYPDDGKDFYTIIRRADEALYQAKNNGRNQIILAGKQLPTKVLD